MMRKWKLAASVGLVSVLLLSALYILIFTAFYGYWESTDLSEARVIAQQTFEDRCKREGWNVSDFSGPIVEPTGATVPTIWGGSKEIRAWDFEYRWKTRRSPPIVIGVCARGMVDP